MPFCRPLLSHRFPCPGRSAIRVAFSEGVPGENPLPTSSVALGSRPHPQEFSAKMELVRLFTAEQDHSDHDKFGRVRSKARDG